MNCLILIVPIYFPIICGTSAGGLNAAGLVCRADCLGEAVSQLEFVWSNFKTLTKVYRTDWAGVLHCAARFYGQWPLVVCIKIDLCLYWIIHHYTFY